MKERQRWRSEEDALLRAYVKQYGPREWHLVSQRMNMPLHRDPKSCLERWKNYLKPGIKKGALTPEEQTLVISLQAKHGNKWKTIAAEVPGRTAKRLGKWWEVFKEKQHREQLNDTVSRAPLAVEQAKYDRILENFAEKLVNGRRATPLMEAPLPPSVALSLSSSLRSAPKTPLWVPMESSELEEAWKAWEAHRKEASWRLSRMELQMESEKASRLKEKVEEVEKKMRVLREEQRLAMESIDAEYRDKFACIRREVDEIDEKLAERMATNHRRLRRLVEQLGFRRWPPASEKNVVEGI